MTAVPISIRLRPRADRGEQRERRGELAGEVVDPVVRAVGTELLGGDRELDRLEQRVRRVPDLRVRRVRPVAERQEPDLLHAPIVGRARGHRPHVDPFAGRTADRGSSALESGAVPIGARRSIGSNCRVAEALRPESVRLGPIAPTQRPTQDDPRGGRSSSVATPRSTFIHAIAEPGHGPSPRRAATAFAVVAGIRRRERASRRCGRRLGSPVCCAARGAG